MVETNIRYVIHMQDFYLCKRYRVHKNYSASNTRRRGLDLTKPLSHALQYPIKVNHWFKVTAIVYLCGPCAVYSRGSPAKYSDPFSCITVTSTSTILYFVMELVGDAGEPYCYSYR